MVASTPSTRKAKSRKHQQHVAELIRITFDLPEEDVVSRPMGSPGVDIMLSEKARELFPFGIECKRVESLSIPSWWKQCETNAKEEGLNPMLIYRRNKEPSMVVMRFEDFLEVIV